LANILIALPNKQPRLVDAQNASTSNGSTELTAEVNIPIKGKSCQKISGQYEVTLIDDVINNPTILKKTINDLTEKIKRSSVDIIDVLDNTGILIINGPNDQTLDKLVNHLRADPRVSAVEQSSCVSPFS
jgi:hypothetical protein